MASLLVIQAGGSIGHSPWLLAHELRHASVPATVGKDLHQAIMRALAQHIRQSRMTAAAVASRAF